MIAFVDYMDRFYAPIDNLSGRYTILQTALASAEKVFTILDEDEELRDPARRPPAPVEPLSDEVRNFSPAEPLVLDRKKLFDNLRAAPRGSSGGPLRDQI